MDSLQLRMQVRLAFAHVKRDEDCTLHQAELADQSLSRDVSEDQYDLARLLDPETDWQAIKPAALDDCRHALSFLSPQSWRFYLPAYICRALDLLAVPLWDSWLPASVVFHLTLPAKASGVRSYVVDRFETLDAAQCAAVAAFLEFASAHACEAGGLGDDARMALNSYWGLAPGQRPRLVIAQ